MYRRILDEFPREEELSGTQLLIMLLLVRTAFDIKGQKFGTVKKNISNIANRCKIRRNTASSNIEILEKEGFIEVNNKYIKIIGYEDYLFSPEKVAKEKKLGHDFKSEEKEEQLIHNAVKEFYKEEQNKEPVAPPEVESDIDVSLEEENRLEEGLDAIESIFEELEEPKKSKFDLDDTKRSKIDETLKKLMSSKEIEYKPIVYSKIEENAVKSKKYGVR